MRRWHQGMTGIGLVCLGTLFGCASTGETSKNILSIQRLAPYT
ncbi:MAG TPA: hypothetical protein VN604_10480 [Nitrospirota bacterium]|nr:hypothetical protein [Nitrospirota bacterium]